MFCKDDGVAWCSIVLSLSSGIIVSIFIQRFLLSWVMMLHRLSKLKARRRLLGLSETGLALLMQMKQSSA